MSKNLNVTWVDTEERLNQLAAMMKNQLGPRWSSIWEHDIRVTEDGVVLSIIAARCVVAAIAERNSLINELAEKTFNETN